MKTSQMDLRSNLRSPSADAKIEFLQYEQPPLESGVYDVTVSQTVTVDGEPHAVPSRTLTFAVLGERFGPLAPEDIAAVFPPDGSVGEHSNVLPHISLRRSTLPWERLPGSRTRTCPGSRCCSFATRTSRDRRTARRCSRPRA
ncbi:hypothetical protein ACN28S_21990 [Cystobacter fuscus]